MQDEHLILSKELIPPEKPPIDWKVETYMREFPNGECRQVRRFSSDTHGVKFVADVVILIQSVLPNGVKMQRPVQENRLCKGATLEEAFAEYEVHANQMRDKLAEQENRSRLEVPTDPALGAALTNRTMPPPGRHGKNRRRKG